MSSCTSIVLVTSPSDSGVKILNDFLLEQGFPALKETSDAAATFQKYMHVDVWQGAYNYFGKALEAFKDMVKYRVHWRNPGGVICVVNHESFCSGNTIILPQIEDHKIV